jgi:RNA polymerase sigma factor for flagellar operon FliA
MIVPTSARLAATPGVGEPAARGEVEGEAAAVTTIWGGCRTTETPIGSLGEQFRPINPCSVDTRRPYVNGLSQQPTRLDGHTVEKLIRAWTKDGDAAARDRVVRSYAPMVKYLVTRKIRGLPSNCQFDDLVSCGMFALMQAIDRFDPSKGVFHTYVWNRVSGEILDELRRMDPAPRSVRRRGIQIASVREMLRRRTGTVPTNGEVADEMGLSVDKVERYLDELDRVKVVSLSEPVRGRDGSEYVLAELGSMLEAVPTSTGDPVMAALSSDRARVMREGIASLSERERMVLFLIYIEGLTGSEAGSLIGVSESRVSQILSGIRQKLRSHLHRSDAGDLLDLAA